MKFNILSAASLLATFFTAATALAQSGGGYNLSWNTISAGGGACAAGGFALSGTIGQPDTGAATGGSYSVSGGFWVGAQPEPSPPLRIEHSGGFLIVSWPSSFTGFSLQESGDLATSRWTAVAATPVESGGENLVLLPATASNRFYRLAKP